MFVGVYDGNYCLAATDSEKNSTVSSDSESMKNLQSTETLQDSIYQQTQELNPANSKSNKSSQQISQITIDGNVRVEDSAILNVMETKIGSQLDSSLISSDIRSIYSLGYFSAIETTVIQDDHSGELILKLAVKEKPAITEISYENISENDSEDIAKQLITVKYKIVSEKDLNADLATIKQFYQSSGYFMARADYRLKYLSENDVELIFYVDKGNRVFVSDVSFIGNHSIEDGVLLSVIQNRPFDRMENFRSPYYSDQVASYDQQLITYFYQNSGYAEVKVAEPLKIISADRKYIQLVFYIEEGQKFTFSEINFSGDLLIDKDSLHQTFAIQPGDLFRISQLQSGVEKLIDAYGDIGYAFVDVRPDSSINYQSSTIALNIDISSGHKAYIGKIDIIGNNKTRDNVIRRELTITDGELYSRTKIRESEKNISRLGFFESVKMIRRVDTKDNTLLHYTVKVEEKSTGGVQASVGYTPGGETKANWFAQGKYEEKNQSGRGWTLGLQATYTDPQTNSIGLQFYNPKVNNSKWSYSLGVNRQKQNIITLGFDVLELQNTFYTTAGREIWNLIRGSLGFEFTQSIQDSKIYIGDHLLLSGNTIGMTLSLSRKDLDDYIDPTSGTSIRFLQRFVGGPFGGDYSFSESEIGVKYYHPLVLFENFSTHFKLSASFARIGSYFGQSPPLFERYRLGGPFDLRGYESNSISPRFVLLRSPFDVDFRSFYPKGGNRQVVFQAEYYIPLLPELKMKSLLLADAGRVFDNNQNFTLTDMFYNVGFGIRWITPMGPLRFEWAFPVLQDGSLGPYRIVFNIGY